MKRIWLSTVVLVAVMGSSTQAQAGAFDDVPVGSWPYSAVARLAELGQMDKKAAPIGNRPITRYEFAVIVARWDNRHPDFGDSATESQVTDIILALRREFEDELFRLTNREGHEPRGGKVEVRIAPPPRYKLIRGYFLRRKPQLEETRNGPPLQDFPTLIREAVKDDQEKK